MHILTVISHNEIVISPNSHVNWVYSSTPLKAELKCVPKVEVRENRLLNERVL